MIPPQKLPVRLAGLAAVTAVFLAAAGCEPGDATTDEEAGAAPPTAVPVQAAAARATPLRPSLELIGTLAAVPERTADVCARTAGTIEKLQVAESDAVHAGDMLVRLDSRPKEADLEKATAAVQENEAILKRLHAGPLPQEIEAARQKAQKTGANVKTLQAKTEAMRPLLDRQEISPVQYHSLEASLAAAKAEQAAAQAELELLEAGTRPELIAEAEAKLAAAKADQTAARLALEFCTVTSPIDGRVSDLPVRRGQFVSEGTRVAAVVDTSQIFARIRVPVGSLAQVKPGAPVEVRVGSLPGRVFRGSITRLAVTAREGTGEVAAFATVADGALDLRPGLACRVTVHLPPIEDAVVIPAAAVADRDGTPVVTIIRGGKAYETEVKLGVQTRDEVQIIEGLAAGDQVATEGGYGLPEGCPVRVKDGPQAEKEAPDHSR